MVHDPLLPDSADAHSASSDTQATAGTLAQETTDSNQPQSPLPESYEENRLVLLPVNTQTQHLYWELTHDYLKTKTGHRHSNFSLRLYLLEPVKKEIESLDLIQMRGSTYTYHKLNFQKLQATLVAHVNDQEVVLLESTIVTTPSGTIHTSPWEIWITKGQEGITTHPKKSVDAPTPEALTSPSSLDHVLNEEQLQMRLSKLGLDNPSSDHGSLDHFSSQSLLKKKGF